MLTEGGQAVEIDHLLDELFQAQEDWAVTTTGSTYTITPQRSEQAENAETAELQA
jgi:hypothetical protein